VSLDLKPIDSPPSLRRNKYKNLLEKFLEDSDVKYAEVVFQDISPLSVVQSLNKAIKSSERYSKIQARRAGGKVYLIKEDS